MIFLTCIIDKGKELLKIERKGAERAVGITATNKIMLI